MKLDSLTAAQLTTLYAHLCEMAHPLPKPPRSFKNRAAALAALQELNLGGWEPRMDPMEIEDVFGYYASRLFEPCSQERHSGTFEEARAVMRWTTAVSTKRFLARYPKSAAGRAVEQEQRKAAREAHESQRIALLRGDNPKKKGTLAWDKWALYRHGMTVEEALATGIIAPSTIRWDVDHELIKLIPAGAELPPAPAASAPAGESVRDTGQGARVLVQYEGEFLEGTVVTKARTRVFVEFKNQRGRTETAWFAQSKVRPRR